MSYRNHEGYNDPTAGAALANIMREERRRKRRGRDRPPERMGKRYHHTDGRWLNDQDKSLELKSAVTYTVTGKERKTPWKRNCMT